MITLEGWTARLASLHALVQEFAVAVARLEGQRADVEVDAAPLDPVTRGLLLSTVDGIAEAAAAAVDALRLVGEGTALVGDGLQQVLEGLDAEERRLAAWSDELERRSR